MNVIPYDKFEFIVDGKMSEVSKQLVSKTAPISFFNSSTGKEIFRGDINIDSFKICCINYSKFCPILYGHMESDSNDSNRTKIKVKIIFHPLSIMFLIFWFISAPIFFGALGVSMTKYLWTTIFPILSIYLLYWFELKQTKVKFLEVFEIK